MMEYLSASSSSSKALSFAWSESMGSSCFAGAGAEDFDTDLDLGGDLYAFGFDDCSADGDEDDEAVRDVTDGAAFSCLSSGCSSPEYVSSLGSTSDEDDDDENDEGLDWECQDLEALWSARVDEDDYKADVADVARADVSSAWLPQQRDTFLEAIKKIDISPLSPRLTPRTPRCAIFAKRQRV